jgi:regulator of ribonuclease activity A
MRRAAIATGGNQLRNLPKPKLATADVCDAIGSTAAVLAVDFTNYGGRVDFAGPAVTVRTLDDNSKMKALLASPGQSRVLVVDGGDSNRAALMGGNLAADASKNNWAGVVIYGRVRDRHEICHADVGIKATGACPRRPNQNDGGEQDVILAFGGVVIHPGDWIIADADGVVVTRELPSL